MPSFALLVAYDGSDFAGWWRQPGERTVAGVCDAACVRLGEDAASAVGASRTDAGVHARGQVAHLAVERDWSASDLHAALNHHLPADAACLAVAAVADTFHACHDAVEKNYSFCIDNGTVANPFAHRYAWRPPFRLDLDILNSVAQSIPGRRDWRAFARRGDSRNDLVRSISDVHWHSDGSRLICAVNGDGFIYRLVRSLIGAMVAVAHGSCSRHDLDLALRGEDSPASAQQAPAHGLCLEHVRYAEELRWHKE